MAARERNLECARLRSAKGGVGSYKAKQASQPKQAEVGFPERTGANENDEEVLFLIILGRPEAAKAQDLLRKAVPRVGSEHVSCVP